MKKFLIAALSLSMFLAIGARAHACSASFLGSCTWAGGNNPAACDFSAFYDCGNAISSAYDWNYGDGSTGTGLISSHTYTNPATAGAYTVTWKLTCTDGCVATTSRILCFTVGTGGCIEPNKGWN